MAGIPEELRLYRRSVIQKRYEEEGSVPIAKDLGLTRGAVLNMAKRMGLTFKDRYKKHSKKVMEGNFSCFHDYFETWSDNMAYCLGYIFADGCVTKYYLALRCHSKDEELIIAIHNELRSTVKIHRKDANNTQGRNNGPQTFCNISSRKLVMSLEKFGIVPRKTYKDLPMPKIPLKYFGHFVRGYFDGDGHVGIRVEENGNSRGRFSMVGTPSFMKSMKEIICFITDILETKTTVQKILHSIEWSGFDDLKKIYSLIYPDGDYLYLKRKKEVFDKIMTLKIRPTRNILSTRRI